MTPTERAKRSDALYYETVSVTRRVLCDMIANREADLEDARAESEHMRLKALAVAGELQEESERLKADNAKLREQIDAAHMSRLLTENENESLRGLVRLMWKPFCWAQSGCEACLTDEQDAEIRDKVRELGVDE